MTEQELRDAGGKIRLVVCDMDGTLLDGEKRLSERNMEAIRAARKQGISTTICSGRLYLMLAAYVKAIEPDVPFISGNGAAIVDPGGNRVLHQKLLPVDDARRFFSFCARIGLDYCALGPEGGFFSRDGRCIDRFTNYNKIAVATGVEEIPLRSFDDDHENALRSPIHKVLLYRLDEKERTGVEEFLRDFRGLAYTFSSATLMEVLALGVDKGYGVRELARITGFKKEEICVFGDYINDIPMFGEAGLSFAMANACEEARNATDGLTASNDRDGVALALEKYILR